MRNLKRALSLTLASVMLLGMMVVGSSAAAGYDDVSKDDNVEAIEVLQAIEVMVGDERGFGPERPVNRAEMAVVMGKLLSLDYNYYSTSCPFNDVYDWAQGWVGACAANGIVSGRGDGIYDPGATVTAVEAASMLMRALGYFKYSNDYADGFEVSTVRQGTIIGIFDNVGSSATEPMTRNQIAQMVLNALQTGVVEPDGQTINLTTPDGSVYTGKVNYVNVTSSKTFARAISETRATSVGSQNDGYIVELGERLYDGKLELVNHDLDVFGRPARTWKYNATEIGTYAKKELLKESYTVEVKGREVYDLLGQTTIRDNSVDSYLNGHETEILKAQLVRSNNSGLRDTSRTNANGSNIATTGRGVLTEIYLDDDLDKITIVSIDTYLAKATTDYNENSETVTLNVYNGFSGITKIVDLEDVPAIANLKKDEWVLVNWADESAEVRDKVVVEMMTPEILSDVKVTAFSRSNDESVLNYDTVGERVTDITADGTAYKNNKQAWYKQTTLYDYNADLMVDKTYTLYLDQYGNFIGAELYSGQDQYVFITGYDRPKSNISVNTSKAAAIFTDGTMAAIDVNVKDTDSNIKAYNDRKYPAGYTEANCDYIRWSEYHPAANQMGKDSNSDGNPYENMWYKYTLKDNVYTLSPVDHYTRDVNENAIGGEEKTINCTNVRLVVTTPNGIGDGRSYGEDDSIYITVDDGDVDYYPNNAIVEVTGRYTGVQNVNLVYNPGRWAHAVYNDEGFIVAAIIYGEAEGIVDNYAYIRGGAKNERLEADGTHYWDFNAIMNGELVTKTIKSRFSSTVNTLRPGTVQELVLDADGYVTTIKDLDNGEGLNDKDEVYSNYDFNRTTTNDSGLLDKYEVYDITIGSVLNPTAEVIGTLVPGNSGRYMIGVSHSGRTLHYDRSGNDIGLDFTADAKAVVRQTINREDKWTAYTGSDAVKTAFNTLMDADNNTANNNVNGVTKQFSGRVVAVLNAQGVAEWVFFDDFTPVNSTDKDYTTPVTGERISQYSTLTRVNELLKTGNVIIDGEWLPNDVTATNRTLYIPENRTLTILGDFNAWNNTGSPTPNHILVAADSRTTSKLVVGTAAEAANARLTLVQDVNFPVEARNMTIGGATATISQPVSVANNLTVNTALTIARGVTVTAGSVNGSAATPITVNGTLNIGGNLSISANVYSVSSLIVKGSVTNNAIITVGDNADGDNNGYVEIGTLTAGSTVVMQNYTATARASVVETVVNNAVVNVQSGALTVSKKLDTAKVAVAGGATLTVKAGAELGSNSKFELETSETKIEGGVSSDLVIRPATNVGSTEGTEEIPVPETTTSVPVKSPFKAQPTSAAEAEAMIEQSMKAMAPGVTTGLTQTWTPSAKENAGQSAENTKGVLALSGTVKRLTEDNFTPSMIAGWCSLEGWDNFIAAPNSQDLTKSGYDLKDKEFGFVVVQLEDGEDYEMLVVKNASTGKFEMVIRNGSTGALTYHAPRIKGFGETPVYYTIDLSGLR